MTDHPYHQRLRVFLRAKALRARGRSFTEIGEDLGVSRQRAQVIIARGWPFPRGPHSQQTCSHEGCQEKEAVDGLCPRHYTKRFSEVVTEGDRDLSAVLARYR